MYDKSTDYKFRREEGYRLWYRFYELERDIPFFSDRDSQIYYNILQVSEDRRNVSSNEPDFVSQLNPPMPVLFNCFPDFLLNEGLS